MQKSLIYVCLTLALACLLLFGKTAGYGFVWDDERTHLTGNRQLMEGNTKHFWKHSYEGLYIPVSYSVWGWFVNGEKDVQKVGPLKPATFHKLNIVLHIFCCCLLAMIMWLLFPQPWIVLLASLLFAVHPLQVETVAWVSEARGLLATLFMFFSLWIYLRERLKQEAITIGKVSLCALFFVLSLLSKPSVIIFPIIIFLFEYFYFKSRGWKRYIPFIVFLVITLPVIFLMPAMQPANDQTVTVPFLQRLCLGFSSLFFYVQKLFVPIKLSPSYGWIPKSMNTFTIYGGCVAMTIILLLLFLFRKKIHSIYFMGIGIFLLAFIPTSGIIPFHFQKFSTVADRYAYISLAGVAIIVAGILNEYKKAKYVFPVLLLFFVIKTYAYLPVWKDEFSLWKHADENYSRQLHVNINLGIEYHEKRMYKQAVEKYNTAIEIDPAIAKTYTNRGNSYAFMMMFDKAIDDFTRSIQLDSNYANAYYNRSIAYFQTNKLNEAYNDMQKAESLGYFVHPNYKRDLKNEMMKVFRKGN